MVAAILLVGLSGCFSPKRKLVLPPPAPVVARPAPQPEIETPPEMESRLPPIELPPLTLEAPQPIETPPPKPVQRRRPGTVTPTPTTPGPPVPETEPMPVPATPQLGEILTDGRRRQLEGDFNARVSRAQAAVNRASSRKLTTRQRETLQNIRTFLQQAEAAKGKDLVTALELARRADLLGRDLLNSLQ
jgi:hypothetical protein